MLLEKPRVAGCQPIMSTPETCFPVTSDDPVIILLAIFVQTLLVDIRVDAGACNRENGCCGDGLCTIDC